MEDTKKRLIDVQKIKQNPKKHQINLQIGIRKRLIEYLKIELEKLQNEIKELEQTSDRE